mmetsp:Transcript_18988/g.55057  ORF Transcript_18988/g.55057 Transcript_18988/m.55057 type:complete len:211 (-) Transcript_18988:116-748(-)
MLGLHGALDAFAAQLLRPQPQGGGLRRFIALEADEDRVVDVRLDAAQISELGAAREQLAQLLLGNPLRQVVQDQGVPPVLHRRPDQHAADVYAQHVGPLRGGQQRLDVRGSGPQLGDVVVGSQDAKRYVHLRSHVLTDEAVLGQVGLRKKVFQTFLGVVQLFRCCFGANLLPLLLPRMLLFIFSAHRPDVCARLLLRVVLLLSVRRSNRT